MKNITVLSITMLLFYASNLNSQNNDHLEGVWKMIYQRFETPDKVFTDKYFSLSGIDVETYTEHIIYSDYAPVIGKSIKMKSKMDGTSWTVEGVIPIEYKLRIFSRFRELKFTETWQRVE